MSTGGEEQQAFDLEPGVHYIEDSACPGDVWRARSLRGLLLSEHLVVPPLAAARPPSRGRAPSALARGRVFPIPQSTFSSVPLETGVRSVGVNVGRTLHGILRRPF